MSFWAEALKTIPKLPARYPIGATVFGLLILLLPDVAAKEFGIVNIRDTYGSWVGIATLAALMLSLVQLVPWFQQLFDTRNHKTRILAFICSLSKAERHLLATCVVKREQTCIRYLGDSTAQSLCDKGLLFTSKSAGMTKTWPYTIPPFVWKYINKNRHLLLSDNEWKALERRN